MKWRTLYSLGLGVSCDSAWQLVDDHNLCSRLNYTKVGSPLLSLPKTVIQSPYAFVVSPKVAGILAGQSLP